MRHRVPTNTAYPANVGPPPGVRHQPRRIRLTVDALPDGRLRVSTDGARGWAAVARGPHQLATVIGRAFTEEAVAAYARWRTQRYDLDQLTERDDPTEPPRRPISYRRPAGVQGTSYGRGRVVRPDQSNPADWSPLPDGRWRSPGGKTYRSPKILGPLLRRRAQLGLPTTYEQAQQRQDRGAA
ncbi:hypothetical protein [Pseudonocardia sp. NPDC049635]|uniref:hypothetical protein n=1 Tax=Pseudonocardia sp. NPDC049635 TaxID=3155506 RepID=UPI0033F55669